MLYPAELRDLTQQRRFYFTRTLGANASTLLFFRKSRPRTYRRWKSSVYRTPSTLEARHLPTGSHSFGAVISRAALATPMMLGHAASIRLFPLAATLSDQANAACVNQYERLFKQLSVI
jgi:hypothetical protein